LPGAIKVLPEPEQRQLQQELQYTLRLHSPIYRAEQPTDFSPQQKCKYFKEITEKLPGIFKNYFVAVVPHERTPSLEKVCQDFNLDTPIQ